MGNYYTVADARADGITETEASDDKLNSVVSFAEEFLERATGRIFYKRILTLQLDGTGNSILWLREHRPIINIEHIKINGSEVGQDYYAVYTDEGYVQFLKSISNIYMGVRYGIFPKGEKNIEVKGEFGYVTIPALVKECVKKLVLREIRPKTKVGQYRSERISGYSYTLRDTGKTKKTGDPEIDSLISLLSSNFADSMQVI